MVPQSGSSPAITVIQLPLPPYLFFFECMTYLSVTGPLHFLVLLPRMLSLPLPYIYMVCLWASVQGLLFSGAQPNQLAQNSISPHLTSPHPMPSRCLYFSFKSLLPLTCVSSTPRLLPHTQWDCHTYIHVEWIKSFIVNKTPMTPWSFSVNKT